METNKSMFGLREKRTSSAVSFLFASISLATNSLLSLMGDSGGSGARRNS
ncbi:MAG: hypothetical protein SOV61_02705 [Lachnospiraceae bacterium]|nr:hypothetical protein [Lachnospiraceae bacterium]